MPFLKVSDGIKTDLKKKKISLEKKFPDEPYSKNRQLYLPGLSIKEAPGNLNKEKGTRYEIYVGKLYENDGYRVFYHGIEKGAHDLGRDLICKSHDYTVIVQCKYYEKGKSISLNDIYQFYGSVRHYAIEHPKEIVVGSFWTNLNMFKSKKAFEAAVVLGIRIHDEAFP